LRGTTINAGGIDERERERESREERVRNIREIKKEKNSILLLFCLIK
jgi:hypothetical protein